ncbi:helicase with zinc finger domain 2-like [Betta splendens]|uniref:Helicase with zinc finger domain 2-like n=1 Tax=Betta splendens TaxID=158456 RepID=A0A8M1H8C1_BETSP|nr:helicase with zinc finger domain 2-like [Betta splendens]XP_055361308.1 helicase with zinc finger domain 2-like [Betta splendens]
MSEGVSRLAPLLSTHDIKLVCAQCSVKKKEISYTLKSVQHQCGRNLLLCRVRGCSTWRPVARRPTFPNPSQYVVCNFFVENFGCTKHRNRCTFARSEEEAAVWNFVKQYKLDHLLLCNLIAQSEIGPNQVNSAEPLIGLLNTLDLKVVCDQCVIKDKEITYRVGLVSHTCSKTLLLAKAKASDEWRPVSERPISRGFGPNVLYQVCDFYVEGSGCTQHGQRCTYARSTEEAVVWNYGRDNNLEQDELLRLVCQAEAILLTPERAAKNILNEFSGEFIEFCKDCFHDSPQKLTTKRWNDTCSGDAAHTWDPALVHHLSEESGKHIYSEVRPLPHNCQLKYCSHVRQGKPCWHKPGHCKSAQSEVEMAVWKAQLSGIVIRPHLLHVGQQAQTEHRQVSMYCKVCLLVLSSPESFYKHCSSLEHAQLLSEDTTTRWRGRRPPHNHRAQFWLCERPATCEYGVNCPKAHSEEELQEWMMRAEEEEEIRHNIEAQGLMSYNERLLDEYKNSSNEEHIISEQVDDVKISCDEDLTQKCEQINATLKWNFNVETERKLLHVALLKQEPGCSFTLDDTTLAPCIYCPGKRFNSEDMSYNITVSFTSINPGRYEQWLVLDFDMRPVLLRKLRAQVGKIESDDIEQPEVNSGAAFQNAERWHGGNRVIVPFLSRTKEQNKLLKDYKPPQLSFSYKFSHNIQTPLNKENYKERMHLFLYNEEKAEDQVISRLNVRGEIKTMTITPQGQLFCTVSIRCNLTPDTPEGQVLKRSIQSALIAPVSSHDHNPKVYEAIILQDQTRENEIHLKLSEQCCSDLKLKSNESYQMEIQFQQNRSSFCTMHKAVDLLPDTSRVLPDFKNCNVPVNNNSYDKLNLKQQSAVHFIIGSSTGKGSVAPLLIYGPFGTGKTYTLATAARELCKQPHNKVLICTHTNSSADLYIRDHFHPFIEKKNNDIKPIRIKANKQGVALLATDEITLKYCFLSEDRTYFLLPTKATLDCHKVVVTTTTMAKHFHDLQLPEGYFTHILIDEASQMLECEALMALGLSGPNTRVVLVGDHMQMGPKLFSVDDHHRSNHTLLNRLFHYYQEEKCEAAQNSKIIFSENYRSTREIVEFVSTHFYVGKNDVIKASGHVPAPANDHALKMFHVRGKCVLDPFSMSWFNKEVDENVLKAVKEIIYLWPSAWGCRDPSSICVLSEGYQTRMIRNMLSRQSLRKVCVENLANVQGKQFRAVIIAVVQTRDSLKTSDLSGLELFNDARVLNTAMTRAQSQVVVVGDAVALSCFGNCSKIWKSSIDHCIRNNSVAPQHFTKDYFEKDVMETSRFQKTNHMKESNTSSDAILQDLREEFEKLEAEENSFKKSLEFENSNHHKSRSICTVDSQVVELCKKQPEMFMQGTLFRESYNKGYVIPFNDPSRQIHINGRKNLGRAFSGDEVILQNTKVVSVTKEAESARELICRLEDEDHSKPRHSRDQFVRRTMIATTKTAPNVRILVKKNKRNYIPIWEQSYGCWSLSAYERINENLRQNCVFVVQVIEWKEHCYLPLGKVTRTLSVRSPSDALRVLTVEFKIPPNTSNPEEGLSRVDEEEMYRQDLRNVFTFTVDPVGAKDLDDAISVRENKDQYELGIHIADVASFVRRGSDVDERAEKQGATFYCSGENPIHMFHQDLSTRRFSLLPGEDRRVVSLMAKVNKQTNEIIGDPKFQLSLIKSNKQLSYEQAEDIICKSDERSEDIENCVKLAYNFAKTQRKNRQPKDWAYSQPDSDRVPGKRKAHLMIEELSVLFNTHVAKTLTQLGGTKYCTPLRCQEEPEPQKVEEFKEQCREFIPVSFYVRHRFNHDQTNDGKVPNSENFRILTEVWKDIKSAAKENDMDKLIDLIAADDIYPLLQPVTDQFRRCLSKAYVVCSKSSPKADVGHYSLNVNCYTQATSPIRRYMDLILQRLLHSAICNKPVLYSRTEIKTLCGQFERNLKDAKEYEQRAEQISCAVRMKKQSASKVVFVLSAEQERESFIVSFPFKNIFAERLSIMYKDLQLEDQPLYDETNQCIILRWKRRIYSPGTTDIHQEIKLKQDSGPCVELPMKIWEDIIGAIDKENWTHAQELILNNNPEQVKKKGSQKPEDLEGLHLMANTRLCEEKLMPDVHKEHEVDISLQLRAGDTLLIQLTSEINRCVHMPAVQLVYITPKFEICVDHVHNPITCFSQYADEPSRFYYKDTDEYVRICKPLCEMESAATAVSESNGVLIENLVVKFRKEQEAKLTGSFFLSQSWIKEWAIECNLSKCLLCIRKRGLKMDRAPEHSAVVDQKGFTWVAHGVTWKTDEQKNPPNAGIKVEFYINHLPMETIPECIFQKDTDFTVEIIPKLLPDIRKETAVVSIKSACDLVRQIALGSRIPKQIQAVWNVVRKQLPNVLPDLNQSQQCAVDKALNDTFTLIQGPPGTGKTIVGVYIVYRFLDLNSKNQRKCVGPKDEKKKEVILYCGPSNKSVDVVAEYLLKFGDLIKPLRVYSQQVEMLDYPYPDCTLQFSQSAFRSDRSKPELRSITLHHRMRLDQNPYSSQIKEFDHRIKLALEKQAKELTDEEVKTYKKRLKNAREYELKQHDIILCTCTTSSTPSLVNTVSARQILIDECAMATEPQALIPLVCNKPEKVVLIGDHKQLRPIVKNMHVRKLGMARSLFERYITIHLQRAVMLDTQYRMHEDICRFPSDEFYEGKLMTAVEQPNSVLRVKGRTMPIVFGDLKGKTISLVVNTPKGNENSKANREERNAVIDIAEKLVKTAKVEQQSIVILSPYNAQVSEIRDELKQKEMDKVTVTTITKSQGSEWRYVIISTVCSLSSEEIVREPDRAWLSKHLGFVGDPNQINVGITRAKEGLCIIGDQELLSCSQTWKNLLDHYSGRHNAVTNANEISVY